MAYTLHCGDCLEIMRGMADNSVDAVITDPPYDNKTHKGARYGFRKTSSEIPFDPLDDYGFVAELLRVSRGWVIAFCALEMFGDYKSASGENWVRAGFWRRPNGVPQFTGDRPGQPGEGVAIMHAGAKKQWNGGGKHGYWEFCIEQHDRMHPTQKPLPLMVALLTDFTNEGDTILDPFMGSGTTGVACMKTGRNFIGIEKDTTYFEIARARIKQAAQQMILPLGDAVQAEAINGR